MSCFVDITSHSTFKQALVSAKYTKELAIFTFLITWHSRHYVHTVLCLLNNCSTISQPWWEHHIRMYHLTVCWKFAGKNVLGITKVKVVLHHNMADPSVRTFFVCYVDICYNICCSLPSYCLSFAFAHSYSHKYCMLSSTNMLSQSMPSFKLSDRTPDARNWFWQLSVLASLSLV